MFSFMLSLKFFFVDIYDCPTVDSMDNRKCVGLDFSLSH